MITEWLAAGAAVAATIVAVVSVVVGQRTNRDALIAQANAMREAREHEVALVRDDRLWARRSDLYARIAEAVRAHVEGSSHGIPPPDDPRLTSLVSEADVFGSPEIRDLMSQFVYNDPPDEEKIDLWGEIGLQARAELIGTPSARSSGRTIETLFSPRGIVAGRGGPHEGR